MKKYSLLKVIGIFFLCYVALTWIIPTGTYTDGVFTEGVTDPVGLFDIFKSPFSLFSSFLQIGLLVLAVGGLYGVLNKTGVYGKFVNNMANKFSNKKSVFVIISILFFAILSSLTNLNYALFVLIPFFVAIILSLGCNKITALAATFGAILVGAIGSTYGFNVVGYANYFFKLSINYEIIAKVILFVLTIGLYVLFVLGFEKKLNNKETKQKTSKKETKEVVNEVKVDIPLLDKKDEKQKSALPMVIICVLTFIFLLVAMYNWSTMLGFKGFEEIHTALLGVKIYDFTIIANILGDINPLGYWGINELSVVLVLLSLIMAWLYNVKFNDTIDSFLKGAKEMLPVALYVMLANLVFMFLVNTQTGATLYLTIADFFLGITNGFNAITMSLAGITGSLFFNDYPYLLYSLADVISNKYAANISLISFIFQSLHGLMMLVLPVSVMLVAGLSYLNISFKEWFKYIWKYLLVIFVIIMVIIAVLVLI